MRPLKIRTASYCLVVIRMAPSRRLHPAGVTAASGGRPVLYYTWIPWGPSAARGATA